MMTIIRCSIVNYPNASRDTRRPPTGRVAIALLLLLIEKLRHTTA